MGMTIDYDRGVIIRTHKSGMNVYMYVNEPGIYLTAFGREVGEKIAEEAGYDVGRFGKARVKRERMLAAKVAIEEELDGDDTETKTIFTRDGWSLLDIGLGRIHVIDPDGNRLTPVAMPEKQARALLDKLVPQKQEAKSEAKK